MSAFVDVTLYAPNPIKYVIYIFEDFVFQRVEM